MGFVVTADSILEETVTQASIYLDACFILAAINVDDRRHDQVMDILEYFEDQEVTWVTNTHVTTEVVNNLAKIKILRALQVYWECVESVPVARRRPLTTNQQAEIIDYRATESVYKLAKSKGYLEVVKNRYINVNPYELIKFIKKLPLQRIMLKSFYKSAVDTYEDFKELMQEYGIRIKHVSTDEDIEQLATTYTYLLQIEMPDAIHLASAHWNYCDLFLTLDGDFEVGNYDNTDEELPLKMEDRLIRIFKVA